MKKMTFLSLLSFFSIVQAQAQDGYTRLNLSAGLMYKDALTGTVALEFGKKYHRYVEVFADAYKSHVDEGENYVAGVAYKPNILRSTNSYLNFRAGVGVGYNTENMTGNLQLGFEGGYILPGNFVVMLQQKNEGVLGVKRPLRTGLLVGIKFPL